MHKSIHLDGTALNGQVLVRRALGIAAAWLAAGLLCGSVATALEPVAVLAPSDVPPGWTNDFGWSVAISGRYVAVGAPRDPWFNGDATGAVYVFRRQGARWIEQAKLTASDPQWPAQLGWSLAMEGDVIVAGAPSLQFKDCGALAPGAAYVFRRNDRGTPDDLVDDTWDEEAKLVPPPIFELNAFGGSVAISGDMVVIGSSCGGAAVFRRTGSEWSHEITFVGEQSFGLDVDADKDRIIVSGEGVSEGVRSVYIFRRSPEPWQWFGDAVLTFNPDDAVTRDHFGWAVALTGDVALIGAYNTNGNGTGSGSVYAYRRSGPWHWDQEAELEAPDPGEFQHFGQTVAADRDLVLIGRAHAPFPEPLRPLAQLFAYNSAEWQATEALPGPTGRTSRAPALSLNGDYAAVAAHLYAVRSRRSLRDFAVFQRCLMTTGPDWTNPECEAIDLKSDEVVDLVDFEIAVGTMTAPEA